MRDRPNLILYNFEEGMDMLQRADMIVGLEPFSATVDCGPGCVICDMIARYERAQCPMPCRSRGIPEVPAVPANRAHAEVW